MYIMVTYEPKAPKPSVKLVFFYVWLSPKKSCARYWILRSLGASSA